MSWLTWLFLGFVVLFLLGLINRGQQKKRKSIPRITTRIADSLSPEEEALREVRARRLPPFTQNDFTNRRQDQLSQLSTPTQRKLSPETPEKDNWEIKGEVTHEFPVKAVLHLSYVDGNGLATERTVETRRCGQYFDDIMIGGHCRLRNSYRSFLVSRIKSCFDEDTGEVVSDVARYLRTHYEQSPDYTLDQFLNNEYDTLRVLLYVAKADGYLRAPEKAIISAYCREACGDDRITDTMIGNTLARLEVPSIHVFRRIVGKIKDKPSNWRAKIIETVERIIATDKKTHPSEQEALDYLRKRLADASVQ